jgi:hypothetical protein
VSHFLFYGLLFLAALPALAPRWSWFFGATVLFVGVAGLNTWLFMRQLSVATSGEGPAGFAFMLYVEVGAGLFVGSCALRLLLIMVIAVLRRLAPTPQSLFAATSPDSSTKR